MISHHGDRNMRIQAIRRLLILLAGVCLLGFGCSANRKATGPTLAEQVADAYGIARWDEVNELKYTFNMQTSARRVSRTWIWEPKEKRVTFQGSGRDNKPIIITYRTFDVTEDSGESMKRIDRLFMSDQYWFLFPFHLVWDENITLTEKGGQPLPIGAGTARKLVVKFSETDLYFPGDVYELFIGDGNRIVEWVFRRGGAEDSFNPATWEGNTAVGPIMVSTEHYRPEGDFHVWFSDVSVK